MNANDGAKYSFLTIKKNKYIMTKDDFIELIVLHMHNKDVGVGMIYCLTEPEDINSLAADLVKKLNLARVSVSAYRDELLKKADDMKESGKIWHTNEVYIEGLDCALDNMKDHITKLANKH